MKFFFEKSRFFSVIRISKSGYGLYITGHPGNQRAQQVHLIRTHHGDQKVSFFCRTLARGKCSVSYKLKAETPGVVSALPATGEAMYAPELKANSDEFKIETRD